MGNRVYLRCADAAELPPSGAWDEFFRQSGTEYEADSSVPLFWQMLFTIDGIRVFGVDDADYDPGVRPYPYLSCNRVAGIERLKSFIPILAGVLGATKMEVFSQWVSRLEAEPFPNILVQTQELDRMAEAGELAVALVNAIVELDEVLATGKPRFGSATLALAGLAHGKSIGKAGVFDLAGAANDVERPAESEAAGGTGAGTRDPLDSRRGKWWQFWR